LTYATKSLLSRISILFKSALEISPEHAGTFFLVKVAAADAAEDDDDDDDECPTSTMFTWMLSPLSRHDEN
jgi:hypothetical protein